jgi:ElaB/YqjD/DUF883 family membrane-anchored ribosome-binding protein
MFTKKSPEQINTLAEHALQSTQQAVNGALDSVVTTAHEMRQQAEPMLDRASKQVSALVHSGAESVLDTSRHLRDQALHASNSTVKYVKDEPVKSMLIAAATGAALMALVSLLGHSRYRR